MKLRILFIHILFLVAITGSGENICILDSIPTEIEESVTDTFNPDSVFSRLPWWQQLYDNGFRIHDPRINYPKFMRLCLDVYNWGDKTFNSYDEEYVVGVGKNWKATIKNYNWMTSYMMFFEKDKALHMRSDIYNDLGAYLNFMAVSIGYTAKVDDLIGHSIKTRKNFNFSFTSSLFSAQFNYWKTMGDVKITRLGDYNDGKSFAYDFNNIRLRSYAGEVYYFGNHLKYSQAAAYCYSKYQLKSAGSWIVGLGFNHQTLDMDFSSLPQEMHQALPNLDNIYRFRFNDYDVMGGYGYNWVPRPRTWLVNGTILPSIGYRYSYRDSSEGQKNMFSTNIRAQFSILYNHRALFINLLGRFDGHLYFNNNYTLFDSIESLSLIAGVRF